ncbi:MAG: GTPase HflX [Bryobacterales bacterium]|nr:GTPase HflX [Bryobacterales bacterium]
MAELALLAESAGAIVLEQVVQTRPAPEAATLIGSGKAEELAILAGQHQADVVVFDQELTPTQQRNLERALGCKVIDRTQLILDIFARRARTREGQIQVELAQLEYLLPRLAGRGKEMSRLGGGIGTRGPGEMQLETDRRRIFRRTRKIKEELEQVRRHRSVQRRQRGAVPLATAALVGYTNAGKSTLFNRLTQAAVAADARLFATLDPTIRAVTLPSNRRVLLSDTVGFIQNLPTNLIQSFRATLEEVSQASLLVHVVDASSESALEKAAHVDKVLAELGCAQTPQLLVLNKIDLLEDAAAAPEPLARSGRAPAGWVRLSALTGEGLDGLLAAVDRLLPVDPVSRLKLRIPLGEGAALHLLHERARVLSLSYSASECEVEAEVPESIARRLASFIVKA